MSDTGKKAVVFWLSGAGLADVRAIAEVETLIQQGTTVELDPAPISSSQSHHYQFITGRRPECFGFFDTLALRGYSVVEQLEGRDTPPRSLIDLLRTANWMVSYSEVAPAELAASVKSWEQASAPACLVVKSVIHEPITDSVSASIAEAVRQARTAINASGLLALVSDAKPTPVKKFVNINNFLADMGVIERNEQDGSIDWSNSLAHFMGHGQLWVNLLGRDAQGIVHHPDEYEEVCDTLIQALPLKLRDPQTNEAVIERAYRKEELYTGDYLFCAPDLIVVFKPGYVPSPSSTRLQFDETLFTSPAQGTTTIDGAQPATLSGFLVASAPAFKPGATLNEHASLTAAAPTLLHALDVSYGTMDSVALKDCFDPSYLEAHPIRSHDEQQALSEEEEELVINRLRDLGYI